MVVKSECNGANLIERGDSDIVVWSQLDIIIVAVPRQYPKTKVRHAEYGIGIGPLT